MKPVNWPIVVSVGGVVVSIAALAFTYFRWRKERRPKLLVRLVRAIHHSALPGQEGIYTKTAKILIEVYNDGNAAAEAVKVEAEKDYQPHREDLPPTIVITAGFLQPGESQPVLLGRDYQLRGPNRGLPPFTMKAQCKGVFFPWKYTLTPSSVLPVP
ncbi:MAG: hypothetical protein OXH99_14155 [Bryobacterales bacterium]|nr:hypothetical protein [Bryobacterales bacterium]